MNDLSWRPELGAECIDGGVRFSVWAPDATGVVVQIEESAAERAVDLVSRGDGTWSIDLPNAGAGLRYRYRIDDGSPIPDPRSRFQPDGVHAASEVIDPRRFDWTDGDWQGITRDGLIVYELHVGTFTPEGTFAALERELPELKRLGVTAIEIMPVAECPGERNWGYDGVDLFAPSHTYGRPDDLRSLVDAAHAVGLGVILDVVYNHLGPEGNYLRSFSSHYFNPHQQTVWGDALNWDGEGSDHVRQFVIDNACSWIAEYHIDGLRLDATHAIKDSREPTVIAELAHRARTVAQAAGRRIVVIAEDGDHEITRARPLDEDGEGLDAVWADDFHHELRVALTDAHQDYYAAYDGSTASIARAISMGLELGELHPHATPIAPRDEAASFVFCIQNHDQVGNRPFGDRLHHAINRDLYAVATMLLLTAPETPLLFMGQEFLASTPFLYFTDHPAELGRLVTAGRREEFAGFRIFQHPELRESIPDPQAETTFLASKLRLDERERNAGMYALYRELLALRRTDPVLRQNARRTTHAFAPSAEIVIVHRWLEGEGERIVVANLGHQVEFDLGAKPDLQNLAARAWSPVCSTGETRFGGGGEIASVSNAGGSARLQLPARTGTLFHIT